MLIISIDTIHSVKISTFRDIEDYFEIDIEINIHDYSLEVLTLENRRVFEMRGCIDSQELYLYLAGLLDQYK